MNPNEEQFDDFKVAEESPEMENVVANTIVAKELTEVEQYKEEVLDEILGMADSPKDELTQLVVGYIQAMGDVDQVNLCSYDNGNGVALDGWGFNGDEDLVSIDLFLSVYQDPEDGKRINANELDRTSQRERMSYYINNVYNTPSKSVREEMPEPAGDNRDFLPDETWVVLGYVKNDKQLDWIRKTGLYNFRTGTQNGSIRLSRNLVSSRYLLLHAHGESIQFVRLADEGPRVFRRSDLLRMGYPPSDNEEKKKDDIYIVYRLEPNNTEPEWLQYHWQISEVTDNKGNRSAVPEPVKLSDLMLKAKK